MNERPTQSSENSGTRPRVPYALLLVLGVVPSLLWAALGAGSGEVSGSASLYLIMQAIGAAFAVVIITLCIVHFRRSGEVSAPVLGIGQYTA